MQYGTNNTLQERSKKTVSRIVMKWLDYKDGESAL